MVRFQCGYLNRNGHNQGKFLNMTDKYLLQRLFETAAHCRKAQQDYYNQKGTFETNPLKKSYYEETRRREVDLDKLLVKLRELVPELTAPAKG